MTYENAVEWAVQNLPMANYDSFEDWSSDAYSELATPALFGNDKFTSMLRKAWDNEHGRATEESYDEEIEDETPLTYHDDVMSVDRPSREESASNEVTTVYTDQPIEQARQPTIVRPEPQEPQRPIVVNQKVQEFRQVEGRKKPSRISGFLKRLLRRKEKRK